MRDCADDAITNQATVISNQLKETRDAMTTQLKTKCEVLTRDIGNRVEKVCPFKTDTRQISYDFFSFLDCTLLFLVKLALRLMLNNRVFYPAMYCKVLFTASRIFA